MMCRHAQCCSHGMEEVRWLQLALWAMSGSCSHCNELHDALEQALDAARADACIGCRRDDSAAAPATMTAPFCHVALPPLRRIPQHPVSWAGAMPHHGAATEAES
jgi:hypothetical protein